MLCAGAVHRSPSEAPQQAADKFICRSFDAFPYEDAQLVHEYAGYVDTCEDGDYQQEICRAPGFVQRLAYRRVNRSEDEPVTVKKENGKGRGCQPIDGLALQPQLREGQQQEERGGDGQRIDVAGNLSHGMCQKYFCQRHPLCEEACKHHAAGVDQRQAQVELQVGAGLQRGVARTVEADVAHQQVEAGKRNGRIAAGKPCRGAEDAAVDSLEEEKEDEQDAQLPPRRVLHQRVERRGGEIEHQVGLRKPVSLCQQEAVRPLHDARPAQAGEPRDAVDQENKEEDLEKQRRRAAHFRPDAEPARNHDEDIDADHCKRLGQYAGARIQRSCGEARRIRRAEAQEVCVDV